VRLNTSKVLSINAAILIGLFVTTQAHAGVVYSNISTDTLQTLAYAANGFTEIGDQITLGGTERYATLATVQFYNNGSAGLFNATLGLFNIGSPVGSQIGSDFVTTSISAPAGDVFNVSFSLGSILVPDNLIFAVSVSNQDAGLDLIGLNLFEPPTIGSSDNSFAIAHNGSTFVQASTNNANVFFELQADTAPPPPGTPEPATIGFAGTALAALVYARRRFRA